MVVLRGEAFGVRQSSGAFATDFHEGVRAVFYELFAPIEKLHRSAVLNNIQAGARDAS
jgi:hypothetical protein